MRLRDALENRRKLVIAGTVLTVLVSLLIAVKSSRALNHSARQLADAKRSLQTADLQASESINAALRRSDELILLLARQSQPRTEWTYLLEQLKGSFREFVNNPRHPLVMPQETAAAEYYLGRMLMLQGNQVAARRSIQRSIDLADSINDQVLSGRAYNTLACLVAANGEYSTAHAALSECCARLDRVEGQENVLALALRNQGLIERALGRDGSKSALQAVERLEQSADSKVFGLTSELLQDCRMTLCEIYWSQGRIDQAVRLARETHDELKSRFIEVELPSIDKHLVPRNRYINAWRFAQRNLESLQQVQETISAEPESVRFPAETANRWQWHPLVDLTTELISNHLSVAGTMVGEFEHQSGLVLAWGTVDWTQSAALEIAKRVHDRTQLVILTDNEDSLDEAQTALEDADVPLNRVRFGVCDCETPWFRDQGPIVSRSSSGDMIWFDSRLTRDDRNGRIVLDALPTVLRRNWRTRVADFPIYLEGGMLLSNGKGVTVVSSAAVELNRQFGFSDQTIMRELKRVTGADNLCFVNTLMGEPTQHIDLFMTFVNATTVMVGKYDEQTDPNAGVLDSIATSLSKVVVSGKPLKVVRVPMPGYQHPWFPSYTNVVFANGVLLVPSYAGESKRVESEVKRIYQSLLPGWDVQLVDCSRLRYRGGALHCLVSNVGDTPYTPVFPRRSK